MDEPTITVTGFLGTGQEVVAAALAARGWRAEIADPLRTPEGAHILAVADAVNLAETAVDPDYGPLVRAQIAMAGAIVLSRADLVDAEPARRMLQDLAAGRAIVEVVGALDATPAAHPGEPVDLTDRFRTWSYHGPAVLKGDPLDQLLARRPAGLYRLAGTVILGEAGAEVDLAGRFRQIRQADKPLATQLTGCGLAGRFDPRAMDLAFGEAVSQSAYRRGLFGWR